MLHVKQKKESNPYWSVVVFFLIGIFFGYQLQFIIDGLLGIK